MRRGGVGFVIGLALVVAAFRAGAEEPAGDLETLRDGIQKILVRDGVPGAGIALVKGDQILWAGGVGLADVARRRAVTADTFFRVGSITKSFVALELVKLAEAGKIDLGARVADLAPELRIENRWAAEQPITVAHLLEHTAGFDDMRPNETYAPLSAERLPLRQVLARNPGSRVARWRPGSRFSYANPGYTVAAYLIEKVTGEPYEDVIRRDLFDPLGMTHATLRLSPAATALLANGYGPHGEPVPYAAIYHRPAGNLMTSPHELAELVKLDLARGAPAVSPAGFARTERSETAKLSSDDASYGLGNYGEVRERVRLRGHGGGIDGFLSLYQYAPDAGFGFVVLMNSTRSGRALVEIRHLIVEYLIGQSAVPPPPPRVPVPAADLERWAGVYHFGAPRHSLLAFLERLGPSFEVTVTDGRLRFRPIPGGSPIELLPLGDDRFRLPIASGSHVAFGRDAEGRRILVFDTAYLVEEPRWLTTVFRSGAALALWLLASGVSLPLVVFARRARPGPGFAWPLAASLSFFAMPRLAGLAAQAHGLGELNIYTLGVCLLGPAFAIASSGSAVQALIWLPRPAPLRTKIHRLAFAVAALATTVFLAHYGLIGIRLWSY